MQTCTWNEYDLSRLMLGTAQLGMAYGVANTAGRPDFRQAVRLIAAAADGGVNCFDTAAAYGDSEVILGRALDELGLAEQAVVVTKVRALHKEELTDPSRAAHAIEQCVAQSRDRLGLDCLPVVLFHREEDAAYMDILDRLKDRGWLRHAGVSCDHQPEGAKRLLQTKGIAAVQVPGNILDIRHQTAGVFRCAADRGTAVFVRSVYLQGLLLMPEQAIPPGLEAVIPVRRKLALLSAEAGISIADLALRYMLAQAGVACVVVGAETADQVCKNIRMAASGPIPNDLVAAVDTAVTAASLPDLVMTPRLWTTL